MKVYIAGPYTQGDAAFNVRAAIKAADELVLKGHTLFIPHLTHFWHLLSPYPYEFWLEYDKEWLKVCDAVLRLPGKSPGADKEVELADSLGKPVYWSLDEI